MGEAAQPGRVQVNVVIVVVIVYRVHVQLKPATATVQNNNNLTTLENKTNNQTQNSTSTTTIYIYYRRPANKKAARSNCVVILILKSNCAGKHSQNKTNKKVAMFSNMFVIVWGMNAKQKTLVNWNLKKMQWEDESEGVIEIVIKYVP